MKPSPQAAKPLPLTSVGAGQVPTSANEGKSMFRLPPPSPAPMAPLVSGVKAAGPGPPELGGVWRTWPPHKAGPAAAVTVQAMEDTGPEKANTPAEPLITGPMSMAAYQPLPGARPASRSRGTCDSSQAGRSWPGPEAASKRAAALPAAGPAWAT